MKYIIMCGGDYKKWKKPKQIYELNGEPIVARTIRLLRECGIDDIAISSNNPVFEKFGVPVLSHINPWQVYDTNNVRGRWCTAFYPMNEPACYLMGDVVFSRAAIQKIVSTDTDSIEFFASCPPFAKEYKKIYAEPFAFKVVDQKRFRTAITRVNDLESKHAFRRPPIAWELWQVIKNTPLNNVDYTNYVTINDYTCDIDSQNDIKNFEDLGEVMLNE